MWRRLSIGAPREERADSARTPCESRYPVSITEDKGKVNGYGALEAASCPQLSPFSASLSGENTSPGTAPNPVLARLVLPTSFADGEPVPEALLAQVLGSLGAVTPEHLAWEGTFALFGADGKTTMRAVTLIELATADVDGLRRLVGEIACLFGYAALPVYFLAPHGIEYVVQASHGPAGIEHRRLSYEEVRQQWPGSASGVSER